MSEDSPEYSYTPSAAKAHLTGKLRHYRDLLVRKWWVLALGAVVGAMVEAAIARFQAPTYLSVGQMIVNVKLAIPQGSVFTEELSNFLGTQAALMQSAVVVNRAYARISATCTNLSAEPPAIKVSVSPRTTSRPAIRFFRPSRMTSARGLERSRKACSVLSVFVC